MKKIINPLPLRTRTLALAGVALLSAACTQKPYTGDTPPPDSFGIWQVVNCKLYANRGHIHLSTDGKLSNEQIYVKLSSDVPLARTPKAFLSSMPYHPVRLEGYRDHFSFEVPYTPVTAARLLKEDAFLVVDYRPANVGQNLKGYFSTAGLPQAFAYLDKECSDGIMPPPPPPNHATGAFGDDGLHPEPWNDYRNKP